MFLNRTTVEVERGSFKIASGPIPWWGGKTLDASRLRQLYVKKVPHRTKHGYVDRYEVHAVMVDDTHQAILEGLDNQQQARFLEQEIERCLAIEDTPVAGEHT